MTTEGDLIMDVDNKKVKINTYSSFEELTKLQEEKTWIHSVTPVGYKSTLKRDENE